VRIDAAYVGRDQYFPGRSRLLHPCSRRRVHRRVVGLSPREFRAYLIIGALPLPIIDTANRFTLSWVKCERSHGYIEARTILRIRRSRTTRITCIAGRAWVTNQGDLRDFILERGESVDATRGLTIIRALEPALSTSRRRGSSRGSKDSCGWLSLTLRGSNNASPAVGA